MVNKSWCVCHILFLLRLGSMRSDLSTQLVGACASLTVKVWTRREREWEHGGVLLEKDWLRLQKTAGRGERQSVFTKAICAQTPLKFLIYEVVKLSRLSLSPELKRARSAGRRAEPEELALLVAFALFGFFQVDYRWYYYVNEERFKALVLKWIRAKEIMTDLSKNNLFVLVDVLCVVVGKRVQCFNVQCPHFKFISELASCCLNAIFSFLTWDLSF